MQAGNSLSGNRKCMVNRTLERKKTPHHALGSNSRFVMDSTAVFFKEKCKAKGQRIGNQEMCLYRDNPTISRVTNNIIK